MVYNSNKKGLSPLQLSRAIKTGDKTYRIFLGVLAVALFVSSAPASAFETTKASALTLEDMRVEKPLSSFQKSPPSAQADPCLPLLQARHISPSASALSQTSRHSAGKTAAPVALGFVFGVRIALGPKEIVKPSQRVQIGPEIRTDRNGSESYALAVAAYRNCKNQHTLGLQKNYNDKKANY